MNLIDYENRLKILLTEYKTLWADIKSRNERQNNFLQIHITVLTAIIGIALTKSEYWIFMLVPIESSIFGLWLNINSLIILRISEYLLCVIEVQIKETLKKLEGEKSYVEFMNWEIFYRSDTQNKKNIDLIYRKIVLLTFGVPSFFCTLIAFYLNRNDFYLAYSKLNINNLSGTFNELILLPELKQIQFYLPIADLIFCLLFFSMLVLVCDRTKKLNKKATDADKKLKKENEVMTNVEETANNVSV